MMKWLQAIRQSTTYLGVAVIIIIWGGIYLLAGQEHESAYQDAVRQGSNLARVLEEYIKRVVQESDSSLLGLRRAYQKDPRNFDIASWVARTQSHNDLTVQFGIADANGLRQAVKPRTGYLSDLCRRPRALSRSRAMKDRPALYQRPGDRPCHQAS